MSWDRRPIVEFDPLPANNRYDLYLDGSAAPYAQVSTPGQNYHRPAMELGAGGAPPGTSHTITVSSCAVNGAFECCVSAPAGAGLAGGALHNADHAHSG